MGRKNILNTTERAKIDVYNLEGYSNRAIARKIDRSEHAVRNYLKDSASYGSNYQGRSATVLTPQDIRKIHRLASNSALSTNKIRMAAGVMASKSTVRRAILKAPFLKLKKLKKKPPLNPVRKQQRLEFAKQHMTWDVYPQTISNNWKNVVFSDEKKFNLDGPDGYNHYFHDIRKEEKFLSRHHARKGGVMVWGAISYWGAIKLNFVSNKMTGNSYKNMLQSVFPQIQELFGHLQMIFQQDNAPIHNARVVKSWIESQNVELLPWPPYSPDLNIIENVWGWLTRKVYEGDKQYESNEELIAGIEAAWAEISLDYLKSLYYSLKDRMFEVILKKGGSTHY